MLKAYAIAIALSGTVNTQDANTDGYNKNNEKAPVAKHVTIQEELKGNNWGTYKRRIRR